MLSTNVAPLWRAEGDRPQVVLFGSFRATGERVDLAGDV